MYVCMYIRSLCIKTMLWIWIMLCLFLLSFIHNSSYLSPSWFVDMLRWRVIYNYISLCPPLPFLLSPLPLRPIWWQQFTSTPTRQTMIVIKTMQLIHDIISWFLIIICKDLCWVSNLFTNNEVTITRFIRVKPNYMEFAYIPRPTPQISTPFILNHHYGHYNKESYYCGPQ